MNLYRLILLLSIAITVPACTRDADSPEASASPELTQGAATASQGESNEGASAADSERQGHGALPADSDHQVLEGIPSKITMPPKDADTPPIAAGAEVTYVCESGMALRIAFDGVWAHVAWTDGRRLKLSKAANGSADGERYTGEGFTLSRVANVVELSQSQGGQRWRCAEGAASA